MTIKPLLNSNTAADIPDVEAFQRSSRRGP